MAIAREKHGEGKQRMNYLREYEHVDFQINDVALIM